MSRKREDIIFAIELKHFVVGLRDDKGGPVFCDTCHAGSAKILNRSDKDAVRKFMAENYEGKFTRADGKKHTCRTCHGNYLLPNILEGIWKVPPK